MSGEFSDTAPWFAALSQDLMSAGEFGATLDRLCERTPEVVPTTDFVAVTVRRRRGKLETLAHTHESALRCDELQYDLDEGPCMDSAIEDESFLIHSTAEDPRWPRWGPAVAELGVHALISVQLPATVLDPDRDPLGAINIYSRRINAFSEDDLGRARVLAVHGAHALIRSREISTLTDAVDARHQIGVAQGVLMRRYDIGLDQAFELLQRYSSHANTKLRDVAAAVVQQGDLPASYQETSRAATAGPGR